jgi:hypothetical protein
MDQFAMSKSLAARVPTQALETGRKMIQGAVRSRKGRLEAAARACGILQKLYLKRPSSGR